LTKWALAAGAFPKKESDNYGYVLLTWASRQKKDLDIAHISNGISEAGVLVEGAEPKDVLDYSFSFKAQLEARYGLNLAPMSEYYEMITQILIDFLKISDLRLDETATFKILLANIVFVVKSFDLSSQPMIEQIRRFARFNFGQKKNQDVTFDEYFRGCYDEAKEFLANPGIKGFLSNLWAEKGKDESLHLKKFSGQCVAVGQALRSPAAKFPEKYPYDLSVWNNFLHVHLLLLGANNRLELVLELLCAEFLEQGGHRL
jgi:hypothetical protein